MGMHELQPSRGLLSARRPNVRVGTGRLPHPARPIVRFAVAVDASYYVGVAMGCSALALGEKYGDWLIAAACE